MENLKQNKNLKQNIKNMCSRDTGMKWSVTDTRCKDALTPYLFFSIYLCTLLACPFLTIMFVIVKSLLLLFVCKCMHVCMYVCMYYYY